MDELIKKQIKKNCTDYVNRKLSERKSRFKDQQEPLKKSETADPDSEKK